jgi:hypothetical protein
MGSDKKAYDTGKIEDIDPVSDKKLFDLGLVEKYDTRIHGATKGSNKELETANQSLIEANTKIEELETANQSLTGFLKEAITLGKGVVPKGYDNG